MNHIDDPVFRKGLRCACSMQGGIKAVAMKAQVHDSNLSSWLRGKKTLSDEAAERVLNSMGLPGGVPLQNYVYEWSVNWIKGGEFERGVAIYFPNGGLVKRAPWSRWTILDTPKKRFGLGPNPTLPEIYALTDQAHNIRAVIRRAPGVPLAPSDFGKGFSWGGGNVDDAAMDIDTKDTDWSDGPVSLRKFDRSWSSQRTTIKDVVGTLEAYDVDLKKLVDHIKSIYSPRQ